MVPISLDSPARTKSGDVRVRCAKRGKREETKWEFQILRYPLLCTVIHVSLKIERISTTVSNSRFRRLKGKAKGD